MVKLVVPVLRAFLAPTDVGRGGPVAGHQQQWAWRLLQLLFTFGGCVGVRTDNAEMSSQMVLDSDGRVSYGVTYFSVNQ
jgi:hypothetical protein